ncbi:MAG: transcriptional repressor [Actinobacteria bacterium]|nr:transcriptional repressor [Actinomycetota bacterium]
MTGDLHGTAGERLRRTRQRYTTGRRELVDLLDRMDRPLTIPELLERDPGLSQSSLYRNLQVLEQAEVVRRVVAATDAVARFELTEDLTSHHHHLVCDTCGRIEDFEPSSTVEDALERLVDGEVGRGFRPDHHRLDLVGTCADCS